MGTDQCDHWLYFVTWDILSYWTLSDWDVLVVAVLCVHLRGGAFLRYLSLFIFYLQH